MLPSGHSPVFVALDGYLLMYLLIFPALGGYLLMYLLIAFNRMSRYANFPIVVLTV